MVVNREGKRSRVEGQKQIISNNGCRNHQEGETIHRGKKTGMPLWEKREKGSIEGKHLAV